MQSQEGWKRKQKSENNFAMQILRPRILKRNKKRQPKTVVLYLVIKRFSRTQTSKTDKLIEKPTVRVNRKKWLREKHYKTNKVSTKFLQK